MSDIKIYHVETQEDYDDLMVELEEQGYVWRSHDKPTKYTPITKPPAFIFCRDSQRKEITIGTKRDVEECYLKEVVRHKAEGVKQMEKVGVPQFVADWYEKHEKGRSIYGIIGLLNDLSKCEDEKMFMWKMNCKGRSDHKLSNAQEVIAKMYLNGYEVEEEKKYYWRKKKEYLFDFEEQEYTYLNIDKRTGEAFFGDVFPSSLFETILTETEVRQVVSEEDFNKLERVEIDDVQ